MGACSRSEDSCRERVWDKLMGQESERKKHVGYAESTWIQRTKEHGRWVETPPNDLPMHPTWSKVESLPCTKRDVETAKGEPQTALAKYIVAFLVFLIPSSALSHRKKTRRKGRTAHSPFPHCKASSNSLRRSWKGNGHLELHEIGVSTWTRLDLAFQWLNNESVSKWDCSYYLFIQVFIISLILTQGYVYWF